MDYHIHDSQGEDWQRSADGRSAAGWHAKPPGALRALARRLQRALPLLARHVQAPRQAPSEKPAETAPQIAAGTVHHPPPATNVTILLVGVQEGPMSALARTLAQ